MKFEITKETQERLNRFRDARNWQKYHTPKNLSRAIAIEAAELSELHLWDREPHLSSEMSEIADIAIYLYYYCATIGIDLDLIVQNKITVNESNYPLSNGDRPDRDK